MGTVRIPLTQGKFALIDDEDLPLVGGYRWHAQKNGRTWYAMRKSGATKVSMHRTILGFPPGKVDHKNGDGLDNRRSNLRRCSNSQNCQNRRIAANNTSGYRGVTFIRRCQKWQSGIQVGGKSIHLGWHDTPEAAAKAYDEAATSLFGEFSNPNFPRDPQ